MPHAHSIHCTVIRTRPGRKAAVHWSRHWRCLLGGRPRFVALRLPLTRNGVSSEDGVLQIKSHRQRTPRRGWNATDTALATCNAFARRSRRPHTAAHTWPAVSYRALWFRSSASSSIAISLLWIEPVLPHRTPSALAFAAKFSLRLNVFMSLINLQSIVSFAYLCFVFNPLSYSSGPPHSDSNSEYTQWTGRQSPRDHTSCLVQRWPNSLARTASHRINCSKPPMWMHQSRTIQNFKNWWFRSTSQTFPIFSTDWNLIALWRSQADFKYWMGWFFRWAPQGTWQCLMNSIIKNLWLRHKALHFCVACLESADACSCWHSRYGTPPIKDWRSGSCCFNRQTSAYARLRIW